MSGFSVHYLPVRSDTPNFGRCALLGWDEAIFGFKVGTWQGDESTPLPPAENLGPALQAWMEANEVELLSTHLAADDFPRLSVLGAAGFRFVDLSLLAHARRLDRLPPSRLTIRPAGPTDWPALEQIAGTAFQFGRYHADARFPRALADQRYRLWIRKALQEPAEQEFVYACGPAGQPGGFLHVVLRDTAADLRLVAVDPQQPNAFAALGLFSGALRELFQRGVRTAHARLSAGNVAILNLYSSLGFSCRDPQIVLHLHRSNSRHLPSCP